MLFSVETVSTQLTYWTRISASFPTTLTSVIFTWLHTRKGGGQGNKTKKTSLVTQIQSLKKNGTCSLSLLSTLLVCVTCPPSHSVKVQTNYFFLSFLLLFCFICCRLWRVYWPRTLCPCAIDDVDWIASLLVYYSEQKGGQQKQRPTERKKRKKYNWRVI
jgi:magnesium-transporting ATPase (P-type)